jgi:rhodanese-related sulfurtransferase
MNLLSFGGDPPPRIAMGIPSDGVVVVPADRCSFVQLVPAFDRVWIDWSMFDEPKQSACLAVFHSAAQHLAPGGVLVVSAWPDYSQDLLEELARRVELTLRETRKADVGSIDLTYERTDRFTIHDMVRAARSTIQRVEPCALASQLAGEDRPTVIDTRTPTDRERFGVIPGAIHIPRTILEWSLDPSNGYRNTAINAFDQPIVIVCNGGYSSSLAAANLKAIGFTRVADLVGGHHGWIRAGLPIEPPDRSSLDY